MAKEWQQLVEAISQTRTTLLEHAKTRPPTAAIQHMDELGSVVQRAIKNHGLNMTGRGSTKDGWLSNQTFAKELADDLLKWRDRIKAGKPWYSESQNQNQ